MLENLNLSGANKKVLKNHLHIDENNIYNNPIKTHGYSTQLLDVKAMLNIISFLAQKLNYDDVEEEFKEDYLYGISAISRSAMQLLPTTDEGEMLDSLHKEVYRAEE